MRNHEAHPQKGQVGIPLPIDGPAVFTAGRRGQGISDRDLDRMLKENPARLLGLRRK